MTDKDLRGKRAIVTGSTSGIGLAIARRFAALGADVAINGFGDAHAIERTRGDLEALGPRAIYVAADMSRPADIRRLVEETTAALGGVDILVNNAGIQHVAPITDFPEDRWDAIIAINLSAGFHAIKAVLPAMQARRWGRIINIASAHGLTASPFKSAYVASKHGIVGLGRAVALEVAEQGITCNTLCPGYVKTPLVDKQIAEQAKAHGMSEDRVVREVLLEKQARKEFVEADDLAALASFLCGDAAAGITGAALTMDGGWTQH